MNIKKQSDTKVIVNRDKTKIELDFSNSKSIIINVSAKNTYTIDKPGEYEYEGVSFIAEEIKEDAYQMHINTAVVGFKNNINLLAVDKVVEVSKEFTDKIGSINLIILPFINASFISSLIKKFDPEVVIIINNNDEKENLELKKEGNIEEITGDLKLEEETFNVEEDVLTRLIILH